ncbi:hypothetical protein [Thermococcus sp.]
MVTVEVVDGKMKKPGPPVEPEEIKKQNRKRKSEPTNKSPSNFKGQESVPINASL